MNSSNGATSLASGSYMQLTRNVGTVREAVGTAQVIGRVGPEVEQRIAPADEVVAQSPRPGCAEHHCAVAVGPHHHEADSGRLTRVLISCGYCASIYVRYYLPDHRPLWAQLRL
jgi:hypothetical protein